MNDTPQCYALHKPYGVLSQFTSEGGHPGLQSLNLDLPQDIYPVGRLDRDSEGLLLLSNNSTLIHELLEPSKGHPRTYRVQVEGLASRDQIQAIQKPMNLRIKKKDHRTKPCVARMIEAPKLDERVPPIRERKSIPTSWIDVTLREGKNRQVRRMTAHVGLPTLRLLRIQIGQLTLDDLNLEPGKAVLLNAQQIQHALAIEN